MNCSQLFEMAGLCLNMIHANGVYIEDTSDLRVFADRMGAIGKQDNHPMLNPNRQVILEHQAFGLILRRGDADIGGVASRFINLGATTLSEYWEQEYRVLYGDGITSPTGFPSPLAKAEIRGRIGYLGELYLVRPERGLPGVTPAILRYIQCVAFAQWNLDWVYGFMRKGDMERSKGTDYGFLRQELSAQIWLADEPRRASTEFLVANDAYQIRHIAARCIKDPRSFMPGFEELYSNANDSATAGVS
jgi:hypothetical protein